MEQFVPLGQAELDARKSLESLVVDNPDLQRLEVVLSQFNIFEALGAQRQELRHSDFLAFLLDPRQNHGLGDSFLRRLMQKVLQLEGLAVRPITPLDLDLMHLDDVLVLREWQDIDVFLSDETNKLVVIIENKIDTGEHSHQLKKYAELVRDHYQSYKKLGIYLTPDGDQPSEEEWLYQPVSYGDIVAVLDDFTASRSSTIGGDVLTMIKHYTQMLRRHIVSESEVADLCRRIYRKHQRALDLIFEYRSDRQSLIAEFLVELVKGDADLDLDHHSKGGVYFAFREWDSDLLKVSEGWTKSKLILLFQFVNRPDTLALHLYIGPGDQRTRQELFELASNGSQPFKLGSKSLGAKWNRLYHRTILSPQDYQDSTDEQLEAKITRYWQELRNTDLEIIRRKIATWYRLSPTGVNSVLYNPDDQGENS